MWPFARYSKFGMKKNPKPSLASGEVDDRLQRMFVDFDRVVREFAEECGRDRGSVHVEQEPGSWSVVEALGDGSRIGLGSISYNYYGLQRTFRMTYVLSVTVAVQGIGGLSSYELGQNLLKALKSCAPRNVTFYGEVRE